jgi:hypothetical protein
MKDEPALDIRTKADQLLDLTQAMLTAAKSDDWDEFELQEQQRSAMLEMVFSSQTTIEESDKLHLANVIKEIQLIDKTITDLICQQRDQAAEELRHLKHAREGNKAYRVAADDPSI